MTKTQNIHRGALLLGLIALAGTGCFFGGDSDGSSGSSGSSGSNGYSELSLHNCSAYGISVYRETGPNACDHVGSRGTYAINGAACDETTATPVSVALVAGETNTIWVLYTDSNCVDNPAAPVHCHAEHYVLSGVSGGPTRIDVLTRP